MGCGGSGEVAAVVAVGVVVGDDVCDSGGSWAAARDQRLRRVKIVESVHDENSKLTTTRSPIRICICICRHYFNNTDALIYVVDCCDRDRVGKAASEFKQIIEDPLMQHSVLLVYANKQDLPRALSPSEIVSALGLQGMKGRRWHVQGAVATRGEGLYEGMDWLSGVLKSLNRGVPVSGSG